MPVATFRDQVPGGALFIEHQEPHQKAVLHHIREVTAAYHQRKGVAVMVHLSRQADNLRHARTLIGADHDKDLKDRMR